MGVHRISATPAALSTASATLRRCQPSIPVTRTAGSIHTQWCDHDTGDTTRPNRATQMTASVGSPARRTRRIAQMVTASTRRHAASHSRRRPWSSSPTIRASAPAMFWSVFNDAVPIRSVCSKV